MRRQTAGVRLLWRGLTLACPSCGGRGLFRRWAIFAMRERCPSCGLKFERMEGHWLGAVAVNTVVSAAAVIATVVVAMLVWGTDVSRALLLGLAAPVGVGVPVLFDPVSRTLWTAIDALMRPPGPGDFD